MMYICEYQLIGFIQLDLRQMKNDLTTYLGGCVMIKAIGPVPGSNPQNDHHSVY